MLKGKINSFPCSLAITLQTIAKRMQGFNENRTMISIFNVFQVSTMHAQRKDSEKDLRLE